MSLKFGALGFAGLPAAVLVVFGFWGAGAQQQGAQSSASSSSSSQNAPPAAVAEIPKTPGWYAVPGSTLESVCAPNTDKYDFHDNCRYVIAAWNSAITDTKRDRLVIWGGGHADYAGNEIYAFDLNSLKMERLNDPSPPNDTGKCVETLTDGKPNSRHTYAAITYMENVDRMFDFGGSLNVCGYFGNSTWTLDLATLQWTNMNSSGGKPGALAGPVAAYDPISKTVLLDDSSDLWQYEYASNSYKRLGGRPIDYHMNGVIDPKHKFFFIVGAAGSQGGGLKAISLDTGKYGMQDWSGHAGKTCGPLLTANYPGLAYDSAIDRVVGWPNFGDTVYLFDPDSKACTTQTFPGGPPDSSHQGSDHSTNGTYGRFAYFPSKDVFVVVNQWNHNTYLLKLNPAK
jgi:hypothetical protein